MNKQQKELLRTLVKIERRKINFKLLRFTPYNARTNKDTFVRFELIQELDLCNTTLKSIREAK